MLMLAASAARSGPDMAGPFVMLMQCLLLLFLLSWVASAFRKNKGRARVKGAIAEFAVNHLALHRLGEQYKVYEDLYLPRPDGDGTTQVDHVVVSIYGIFVIETKNYSGWIFGSERQRNWTQCLKGGAKHSFQNPLMQNNLHVNALRQALALPTKSFHSIVYFFGECTFKTSLPDNVMTSGLKKCILSYETPILTPDEVRLACSNLNSYEGERSAMKALHRPQQGDRS
jgi:hypothetical protein